MILLVWEIQVQECQVLGKCLLQNVKWKSQCSHVRLSLNHTTLSVIMLNLGLDIWNWKKISLELQTVTPTSAVPTNVGTVTYFYYQTSNDDDGCKYKQR
jgi:hypothetical protein